MPSIDIDIICCTSLTKVTVHQPAPPRLATVQHYVTDQRAKLEMHMHGTMVHVRASDHVQVSTHEFGRCACSWSWR